MSSMPEPPSLLHRRPIDALPCARALEQRVALILKHRYVALTLLALFPTRSVSYSTACHPEMRHWHWRGRGGSGRSVSREHV